MARMQLAHSAAINEALGFKQLPTEGFAPRMALLPTYNDKAFIALVVHCEPLPAKPATPNKWGHMHRRFALRLKCACHNCGAIMPIGRLAQHCNAVHDGN